MDGGKEKAMVKVVTKSDEKHTVCTVYGYVYNPKKIKKEWKCDLKS